MPAAVAELDRVGKVYRGGAGAVTAVDEVSLAIEAGDFVVVSGRSGSGKSTLLALLGTLCGPSSGRVRLFGRDVGVLSDQERSELRAARLGFVFQFAGLLPTLSAYDNVRVPTLFGPARGAAVDLRARELLRRVGLSERLGAYADELSGGEQRRVALARALLSEPDLLLADEPTGDLDTETERAIMGILEELHGEGLTIVMVTHNLELRSYATRWLEMSDGRVSERNPL